MPPRVLNSDVTLVALDELRPHPRNPRHGDLGAIQESITENGFYGTVVVQRSSGYVLAGNHRLLAARALGATSLPVVYVDVDDEAALRILLADNRTSDLATYDDDGLADLLGELARSDLGLVGTGYSDSDLAELMAAQDGPRGATDPDEVPESPRKAITQPGDLWVMGEHRVLCGDATDPDAYAQLLDGELKGVVVTDPPYGVAIGAKNRALNAIDNARRQLTDLEGDRGIAEVAQLWREAFGVLHAVIPPGTPYYVFGPQSGDLGLAWLSALKETGMAARHILIWAKHRASFSIGHLDYDYQHESIAYGWKSGGPHPWYADGTRTSLLSFDRPAASPDHPTAKPVDLLAHLIANSTRAADTVLDPFGGSGSTLMAAHRLYRRARLIEIEPRYVDVICRRYQAHTGEEPVLGATSEVT